MFLQQILLEAVSGSSDLIQIIPDMHSVKLQITSIHREFQEHTGILKTSLKILFNIGCSAMFNDFMETELSVFHEDLSH